MRTIAGEIGCFTDSRVNHRRRVTHSPAVKWAFGATLSLGLSTTAVHSATFNVFSDESLWKAAAGSTATEDFESYDVGQQVEVLDSIGIVFDALPSGGFPAIYLHSEDTSPYGRKHIGNFPQGIVSGPDRFADIVLRPKLGTTLSAFGFYNGDGQASTTEATAYDLFGNVLGIVTAGKAQFGGFVSDTAIGSVVLDGGVGADGWDHWDGLSTAGSVAPIPLPASAWFTTLGLAALFGVRRRKKGH